MRVESSLGQRMVKIAGGYDDVGLAVHEAASLVGFDFVGDGGHAGAFVQGERLGACRGLTKLVDADLAGGILGSVDGKDVGDGLRGVGWEVVHRDLVEVR